MNGMPTSRHPNQLREALRLHQAGQPREARSRYERLLRREPKNADLLKLQGIACTQLGDFRGALGYLQRALQLRPDDVEVLMQLGSACTQLRQDEQALSLLGRAVDLAPGHPQAHFLLAQQLMQSGQHAHALARYSVVLEKDPAHFGAWRGSGSAAYTLGHLRDALDCYAMALRLQPDDADVLNDRAAIHAQMGDHAKALADYDQLLKNNPDYPKGWNNRGVCLDELGRVEEALESFDRAIALDPQFAEPHSNKGKALMQHARAGEAIAACDRALALRRDYPDAEMNRSMAVLATGALRQGFADYESRWRRHGALRARGLAPRWMGDEDLAGKTLLIIAEQGLGDTLQFCRYALMAVGRAGRVILQAQPPVARLMRSLHPQVQVVDTSAPLPPHDLYCPMMSLPLAFGTDLDSIPAPIPYLHADPQAVATWKERLGADPRLHVGLVWSGGFRQDQPELWAVNRRRNIALELLAPLADAPARFISLQKGADGEEQLHRLAARGWNGPALEDRTAMLGDFADTAALIANLDLVISVDTSTAHLAAALGKPTWILNRLDTCWRWMFERSDTPWYPTARLYRQTRPGQWDDVVQRVRADLVALAVQPRVAA